MLSGTGSTREYIQRLGRILRRGSGNKQAILYEVVAEETAEEGVSQRRRKTPQYNTQPTQLELVPTRYSEESSPPHRIPRAAEKPGQWEEE